MLTHRVLAFVKRACNKTLHGVTWRIHICEVEIAVMQYTRTVARVSRHFEVYLAMKAVGGHNYVEI